MVVSLFSLHAVVLVEHNVVVALFAHVGAHVLDDVVLVCQCESLNCHSCLPCIRCVKAGNSLVQSLLILVLDSVVSEDH